MNGDELESLGELRGEVRGLRAAFEDFRAESRHGQQQILESLSTRLNLHSDRLRALERWRAWIAGGLALLAVLWAAVITWVRRP